MEIIEFGLLALIAYLLMCIVYQNDRAFEAMLEDEGEEEIPPSEELLLNAVIKYADSAGFNKSDHDPLYDDMIALAQAVKEQRERA